MSENTSPNGEGVAVVNAHNNAMSLFRCVGRLRASAMILAFALPIPVSYGCDCEPVSFSDNYNSMTYVFVGRVVAAYEVSQNHNYYEDPQYSVLIEDSVADSATRASGHRVKATESYTAVRFDINELFKGDPKTQKQFRMTWTSCGLPVTVGAVYLVFADQNGFTNKCFGTRALGDPREYDQDKEVQELRRLAKQGD